MRYFRYTLYAICLTIVIWIYPSETFPAEVFQSKRGLTCAPIKEMFRAMLQDRKLGFAATFVAEPGFAMSLFFSERTGEWVILGNPNHETACIMAQGWDFWPVETRAAGY